MKDLNCPNFETIVDYAEQRLPADEAQTVERHLATCIKCQEILREVRQLFALLNEDASIVVPVQAHRKAVALFQPWYQSQIATPEKKPGIWQRLVAQLVFDNKLQGGTPLVPGMSMRSTPTISNINNNMRQLLYKIGDGAIEVDLQLRPTKTTHQFSLLGQVFGSNNTITRVELKSTDNATVSVGAWDDNAAFWFEAIEVGNYQLLIYIDQQLLEISSLVI